MKFSKLAVLLIAGLLSTTSWAALKWAPNGNTHADGQEYTIKSVWEFTDGTTLITAVEVNETVSAGCTSNLPNTFYYFSSPMTTWHQNFSNKLLAAQVSESKIKVAVNVGASGWCNTTYGMVIYGLEVVPQN